MGRTCWIIVITSETIRHSNLCKLSSKTNLQLLNSKTWSCTGWAYWELFLEQAVVSLVRPVRLSPLFAFLFSVFRCSLYTHDTSAPDSLQTCWHVWCCNFMQKQKTHSSSCKLKAVHWQKEKKSFSCSVKCTIILLLQTFLCGTTDYLWWQALANCHHRCRISILFNLAPAVVLLWSSKKLALKPNALYVQSKNRLNTPANISDFSARNSPDHHLHFLHL